MKIILVSGFLGSGKTRFIKSLVEKTDKSIVILENEFGDLNLDSDYLKSDIGDNEDDVKVWELTNGCICCSTNLDFTHSILTIANTLNPDYLIVEPSGVAKINNIIKKIKKISYERIELGLPILIIDAKNYKNILENYSEYVKEELFYNGIVVVSKSENFDDSQFLEIKNALKINNDIKFPFKHYSKWDDGIWDYIFSTTGIFLETDNKLTLKFKIDKKQPEKKLEQYTLKNIGVTSLDKLSYTLLYLMSNKVGKVERVKGNLTVQDNNYKFDLVGNNYEITGNNSSLGNNAVVIGTNLNKDIIEKLFEN